MGVTYAVDGERRRLRGTFGEHHRRVGRPSDLMTCQIGNHVERNEGKREKEVVSPRIGAIRRDVLGGTRWQRCQGWKVVNCMRISWLAIAQMKM